MALRVSLLMAMGIVPFACSGDDDPGDPSPGGAGEAGAGEASGKGGEGGSGTVGGTDQGGQAGSAVGGQGGARFGSCTSPEVDDVTGLVKCAEGYSHRPQAVACGTETGEGGSGGAGEGGAGARLPRADGTVACSGEGGQGGASAGETCAEYHLGYCLAWDDGSLGVPRGWCLSGCVTDEDCGEGFVCLCGHDESPSGGVCRASDCTTDADCADDALCASYDNPSDGCGIFGIEGFACQTAQDECQSDDDCADGDHCLTAAQRDSTAEGRACGGVGVCGRPFLVESTARLPALVACDDWNHPALATPAVAGLSAAERAAHAQHWARLGQMEHASIAAFARFGLQLLALGAPPELVEECARALGDETAHARLCFQLASAYADAPIGPGPLDVGGSLTDVGLLEVVDLVIQEGCVGETTAALDAADSAATASDPVIAAVYARIAEDEERHAALAFRFVRWALERDSAEVEQRVRAALAALPASLGARGVVEPCLRAILSDELLGRRSLRGLGLVAAQLA